METRRFDVFEEAKDFAKSLAQQKIKHSLRRNEFYWVVEYNNLGTRNDGYEIERLKIQIEEKDNEIARLNCKLNNEKEIYEIQIQNLNENNKILLKKTEDELERQKNNFVYKIEILTKENKFLKQNLYEIRMNIENEILEKTKDRKSEMDKLISQLKQEELSFFERRKKFDLIESAYVQHFGKSRVETVKKKIESFKTCPECGGGGGINGGCRMCDGKGWIDIVEEVSSEVVKIG